MKQDILKIMEDNAQNSDWSYVEAVVACYKNKVVEVYMGDTYETITVDQIQNQLPAVLVGKVLGGSRNCLVLETITTHEKNINTGKIILVNGWNIFNVSEVDNTSEFESVIFRSNEAKKVGIHLKE